jgi:hypothetical protein
LAERHGADADDRAGDDVHEREAPVAELGQLVRLGAERRERRVRAQEADDQAA